MLQSKLLKKVLELLDLNGIDYMVTGSLVSSIQGEPRSTHDADIVVNITYSAIPILLDAFNPPSYYLSESAIRDAIDRKSMFNLLDTEEGDKVDFWMLTDDLFDQSRFNRKYEEIIQGLAMKISRPEDTILKKLHWGKLSGGSEKQFKDALRVYEIQYEILDLGYLNAWAQTLGVEESWQRLINEAQPIV